MTFSETRLNLPRCRRLIESAVEGVELDLKGFVVLTEAATGPYALTASIAAKAGADLVVALTRDSYFGTAGEASRQTMLAAHELGVAGAIAITSDRADKRISSVDVVTNVGFVRPIDRSLLAQLKPTAAISLMFEPWEFRQEDIDLMACDDLSIPILGVNESVPQLKTMQYLGPVAIRLLLECDIEVIYSNILILGSGPFATALVEGLRPIAAEIYCVAPMSLGSKGAKDILRKVDALIVAEHQYRECLIGSNGIIGFEELASINPGIVVAHIAGYVDVTDLKKYVLVYAPSRIAAPGYMSVTTAYAGPRPLIDLHAGGLKVGECLARARRSGLGAKDAKLRAIVASPLCAELKQSL